MSWRDIIKAQKPDYLDFDKDGDKEEPMTEALKDRDKVDKSPTRKHYTKDGKEWKGKTHKMPNGNLMSEDPHNEKSVRLYHYDELPKSAARSAFTR
tara:strand:+ start:11899 stop:12186 length:288 start_codon:yes stop_codon:yes gene_type:complete